MPEKKTLLDTFTGGITAMFIGSPGTGKSRLLGTICELIPPEQVLLLAPKPREIQSDLYRRHGLDKTAEVFQDHRWLPAVDSYEADAFLKLQRRILALYEDTQYRAILLDPFTDAVNLAAHDLMKGEKAATPRDMRDSRGFYGALKYKLLDFTRSLVGLSSKALKQPKHVLVAVHAQPAKEDEKAEAAGVEFEGSVLPAVEGGFRHVIAGEFGIVGYTKIKHSNMRDGNKFVPVTEYVVQLGADNERHAKVDFAPALAQKEFPNSLPVILEAALNARVAA